MEKLKQIKREIFLDGRITNEDITKLREFLYEGDGMTKTKGDFLYDLKNTIRPELQTEDFKKLFIEAITILLLEDEVSPGEIDDSEAKWLRAKMQSNGYRDDVDAKLLENLKERSINFPEILQYKGKLARKFENCLYFSRYLTIFAVVASIASSIVLFFKGTMVAVQTLSLFVSSSSISESIEVHDSENIGEYENLLVGFISSVDIYLFAMVLIIFGMGIYELFISKIDPVERKADARPTWLQVSSIDDLKSSLGKVILMVLIVNFFKYTIRVNFESSLDLLYLAIGVVLVSLALFIANKSHGSVNESKKED